MAYYVPLGPRGLILRLGTFLIGMIGGVIYWRDCRRRTLVPIAVLEPIAIQNDH